MRNGTKIALFAIVALVLASVALAAEETKVEKKTWIEKTPEGYVIHFGPPPRRPRDGETASSANVVEESTIPSEVAEIAEYLRSSHHSGVDKRTWIEKTPEGYVIHFGPPPRRPRDDATASAVAKAEDTEKRTWIEKTPEGYVIHFGPPPRRPRDDASAATAEKRTWIEKTPEGYVIHFGPPPRRPRDAAVLSNQFNGASTTPIAFAMVAIAAFAVLFAL